MSSKYLQNETLLIFLSILFVMIISEKLSFFVLFSLTVELLWQKAIFVMTGIQKINFTLKQVNIGNVNLQLYFENTITWEKEVSEKGKKHCN